MEIMILSQVIWLIAEFGIPNFSIEEIVNKEKKIQKQFLSKSLKLNFLFSLMLILLFMFASITEILSINYYLLIAAIPAILFGSLNLLWFFVVIKKLRYLFLIVLLSRIIFTSLVFLINDDTQAHLYFYFQGISFFLIFIFSILYLLKLDYINLVSDNLFIFIKKSSSYFLSNLSDNFLPLIWALFLSLSLNSSEFGHYSLYDQIIRASIALSVIITQTIRIYFNQLSKKLFFTILIFIFLALLSVDLFITFSPILFDFLFDDKFIQSYYLIIPTGFIIFTHFLSRLFGYPVFGVLYSPILFNKISISFMTASAILWLFLVRSTDQSLYSLYSILFIYSAENLFLIGMISYYFFKNKIK
jgi:PST family polysaccharide transporter